MEHVRNNPSIAKYTYTIEYLEKLPSKKNYANTRVPHGGFTIRGTQIRQQPNKCESAKRR